MSATVGVDAAGSIAVDGDASPEVARIGAVLASLFDGLHTCDAELLAQVFHPAALYATATDGSLLTRSMDDYLPIVAARESGASRGDVRDERVLSIRVVAPTVAVAVVSSTMGGLRFDDVLTLIEVDGRWQVVSKVFHSTPGQA